MTPYNNKYRKGSALTMTSHFRVTYTTLFSELLHGV